MDKLLRQIAITVLAALLTALIVAAFSAYVRLSVLEERVAAQEKRMDWFHGEAGK
jgi:hypothetical protein